MVKNVTATLLEPIADTLAMDLTLSPSRSYVDGERTLWVKAPFTGEELPVSAEIVDSVIRGSYAAVLVHVAGDLHVLVINFFSTMSMRLMLLDGSKLDDVFEPNWLHNSGLEKVYKDLRERKGVVAEFERLRGKPSGGGWTACEPEKSEATADMGAGV